MQPTAAGTAPASSCTKGHTQRPAHGQTQVPPRPNSTPRQDTPEGPRPFHGIALTARSQPASRTAQQPQGPPPPSRLGYLPAHSSRPHATGPDTRHLEHQPRQRGDHLQPLPRVYQASGVATAQPTQRQGPVHSQPAEQRVPPPGHHGNTMLGTLASRQRRRPTGPRPPPCPRRPPARRGSARVHPRSSLRPQRAHNGPRRPRSLPQQSQCIRLLPPSRQNAPAAPGRPSLPAQAPARQLSPCRPGHRTPRLPASSRLPGWGHPRPQCLQPSAKMAADGTCRPPAFKPRRR